MDHAEGVLVGLGAYGCLPRGGVDHLGDSGAKGGDDGGGGGVAPVAVRVVGLVAQSVEGFDDGLHLGLAGGLGFPDADGVVGGGEHVFAGVGELFEELFAGACAGDFDLDVGVGLEALEADESAGQVEDADRVAHVEEEHFTASGAGVSPVD